MGRGAGDGLRTWVRSSWLVLSALWYSRSVWCRSFSISRTCRLQLRSSRSNFSTFRLSWASSGSGEGGGDSDNEGDGASEAMGSGARRPVDEEELRSGWGGRRLTQKPRERAGSEQRPHIRLAAAAPGHNARKFVVCVREERLAQSARLWNRKTLSAVEFPTTETAADALQWAGQRSRCHKRWGPFLGWTGSDGPGGGQGRGQKGKWREAQRATCCTCAIPASCGGAGRYLRAWRAAGKTPTVALGWQKIATFGFRLLHLSTSKKGFKLFA